MFTVFYKNALPVINILLFNLFPNTVSCTQQHIIQLIFSYIVIITSKDVSSYLNSYISQYIMKLYDFYRIANESVIAWNSFLPWYGGKNLGVFQWGELQYSIIR